MSFLSHGFIAVTEPGNRVLISFGEHAMYPRWLHFADPYRQARWISVMIYPSLAKDTELKGFCSGAWAPKVLSFERGEEEKSTTSLAITVAVPFPAQQNSRRPIWIENHKDFSGIWNIRTMSAGRTVLHLNKSSKLDWALQRSESGGLVICDPSTVENHPDHPSVVSLAPPLVFLVRCTLLSVSDVNTVGQAFTADASCELSLRGISKVDSLEMMEDFLSAYHVRTDMIQLLNASTDTSLEVWAGTRPSLHHATEETFDYTIKLRAKGIFGEEFELESFPFDEQSLGIVVSFVQAADWVTLAPNEEFPSAFVVSNFQLGNVYRVIHKDVVLVTLSHSTPQESASGLVYPRAAFRVVLQRKASYYLTNVALPMMVVTYLAFLSFAKTQTGEKMDLPDRLSVTLTLLLTAVAYKFVVASLLPQVSYLTQLDAYVSCCFVCMCVVAVVNAVFPYVEARWKINQDIEYIAVGVLLGAFTATNAVWMVRIRLWLRMRRVDNRALLAFESAKKVVANMFSVAPQSYRMELVGHVLDRLGVVPPPHARQAVVSRVVSSQGKDSTSELAAVLQSPETANELVQRIADSIDLR